MKHIPLNKEFNWGGIAATDAFILGTTRGANGISDFTAAATTQSFNLMPLSIGDMVLYPLAAAWVTKRFTDSPTEDAAAVTLANLKLDVGVTADADAFIVGTNGDLLQARGYPISPVLVSAAGGGAARIIAASQFLTCALTSSAGNISTITYGELVIFANIARGAEHYARF